MSRIRFGLGGTDKDSSAKTTHCSKHCDQKVCLSVVHCCLSVGVLEEMKTGKRTFQVQNVQPLEKFCKLCSFPVFNHESSFRIQETFVFNIQKKAKSSFGIVANERQWSQVVCQNNLNLATLHFLCESVVLLGKAFRKQLVSHGLFYSSDESGSSSKGLRDCSIPQHSQRPCSRLPRQPQDITIPSHTRQPQNSLSTS